MAAVGSAQPEREQELATCTLASGTKNWLVLSVQPGALYRQLPVPPPRSAAESKFSAMGSLQPLVVVACARLRLFRQDPGAAPSESKCADGS